MRQHGTRAKYVVDKCRCRPCTDASTAAERHRTRMKAYGRWEPFVDAEPARAHVHDLMAQGMGWKRVAHAASLSPSTVWKLIYGDTTRFDGPSKRCRPQTAAKLLAVALDLAGGAKVSAIPTRRRIQALIWLGYTQSHIAGRVGMLGGNFGTLLHHRSETTKATADRIEAVYDELCMTPAPDSLGASRARQYAARLQFMPPLAWDDIDDPFCVPDLDHQAVDTPAFDEAAVWRATNGDRTVTLTAIDRTQIIRTLHQRGLTDRQMGELTGIKDPATERKRLGLPVNRSGIDWTQYGEQPTRKAIAS